MAGGIGQSRGQPCWGDCPLSCYVLWDDSWKGEQHIHKVKVLLSQHIGAPAVPVVEKGDQVSCGQCIAKPAQGLSVGIHASVDGRVQEVTDKYIVIVRGQ